VFEGRNLKFAQLQTTQSRSDVVCATTSACENPTTRAPPFLRCVFYLLSLSLFFSFFLFTFLPLPLPEACEQATTGTVYVMRTPPSSLYISQVCHSFIHFCSSLSPPLDMHTRRERRKMQNQVPSSPRFCTDDAPKRGTLSSTGTSPPSFSFSHFLLTILHETQSEKWPQERGCATIGGVEEVRPSISIHNYIPPHSPSFYSSHHSFRLENAT
jgi:hypothetical protein